MKAPESFVPLTATPVPAAPREFRVSILNGNCCNTNGHSGDGQNGTNGHAGGQGSVKASGFQSLEGQKAVAFNPNGGEKKIGEPRVTVQRDGDRVTHLRIQCSCGQILDLACVYDAPAGPGK